jgi:hypothetical protein
MDPDKVPSFDEEAKPPAQVELNAPAVGDNESIGGVSAGEDFSSILDSNPEEKVVQYLRRKRQNSET